MIAGSYGKSMFIFVRNRQTAFQSGYATLHSHQQRMSLLVAPHHCQHFVLSVFWVFAILVGNGISLFF